MVKKLGHTKNFEIKWSFENSNWFIFLLTNSELLLEEFMIILTYMTLYQSNDA